MKNRVISLTIAALLALSIAAFARQAQNPKAAGERQAGIQRVAQKLNLSDAQAQQIRTIVQRFRQDAKAQMQSNQSKEDKLAGLKMLRETASADILALLTPEQRQQAEQMDLTQRLLHPRARAGFAMRHVFAQLNLTDAQKASVKSIMEQARTQGKVIKDDNSLDQAAKKARFQELRQQTKEQILGVLTAEQQQKLKDMMEKRHRK